MTVDELFNVHSMHRMPTPCGLGAPERTEMATIAERKQD